MLNIHHVVKQLEKIKLSLNSTTVRKNVDISQLFSYSYEGPLKVAFAALVLKLQDPSADTRYHQTSHNAKYCLRSFEQHTTNWLHVQGYVSTNTCGSLSNELRHKEPYDKNYSRVWRNANCKNAFLV